MTGGFRAAGFVFVSGGELRMFAWRKKRAISMGRETPRSG